MFSMVVVLNFADSSRWGYAQALAMFQRLRLAAAAAGALCTLGLAALLGARPQAQLLAPAAAALVLSVGACAALLARFSARVQAFYFIDYQHSEH